MVKIKNISFYLLGFLLFIFFCIPEFLQIPFKLICLILYNYILFLAYKKYIPIFILFIIGCAVYVISKLYLDSFDTSLLLVILSILPVIYFHKFNVYLDQNRKKKLKKYCSICLVFIIAQLAIFRYNGRPTLSYEINQSGSFLFLFYLLCDLCKFRLGKIVVWISSFLLLSSLLILALICVAILPWLKKFFFKTKKKFPYKKYLIFLSIITILFSFWYTINMVGNIGGGGDSINRLTTINDGSNFVRFSINTKIITSLFSGNDILYFSGYGDLGANEEYGAEFGLMPHNEFLKSIAQFGLIFSLILFYISSRNYTKLCTYHVIEYIIPIILYTLILWVRFCIVPSLEMLLIFYILKFKNDDTESQNNIRYN